jgi:hypothetical protein
MEDDPRALLFGSPDRLEGAVGVAALVGLAPYLSVAPDLQLEVVRQRVHDRDADAVEAARDLVAVFVELSAGVQRGHHHLGGGAMLLGMEIDGDPPPVVHHGDAVVVVDLDRNLVAVARERFIDRVVHDLVDEVVEAVRPRRSDVHRGALPDRIQALENLDVSCGVGRIAHTRPLSALLLNTV